MEKTARIISAFPFIYFFNSFSPSTSQQTGSITTTKGGITTKRVVVSDDTSAQRLICVRVGGGGGVESCACSLAMFSWEQIVN